MTTNTTNQYKHLVRKANFHGRNVWAYDLEIIRWNHRLVRKGGESYIERDRNAHYSNTLKRSVESIAQLVERGAVVVGNRLVLDRRDETA